MLWPIWTLSVLLLFFGLFALVGSLFRWREGCLVSFPEGADYRHPVTDLLVNAPTSMLAGIGFWKRKWFGYIAAQFAAGFYPSASIEIPVDVLGKGRAIPIEIVLPQVLAVAAGLALVL